MTSKSEPKGRIRKSVAKKQNLSELRPADRAVAITRRKAIYISLHPETQHGSLDGKERDSKGRIQSAQNEHSGKADRFTKDIATSPGIGSSRNRERIENFLLAIYP